MRPELAWLTNERLRLAALLLVLAALVAYAVTAWPGRFGLGGGSVTGEAGSDCPVEAAPALASVGRTRLLGLRASEERMMAGVDADLRPYEEGLVPATSAWTDAEPTAWAANSDRWPAGYEMRWWTRDRDDVVADIYVFADPKQARDFSRLVLRAKCRAERTVSAAPTPTGAQDLEWRNPLSFTQEDVYLQRGRYVYRVSVVRPGPESEGAPSRPSRSAAFALVNELADLLRRR